MTSLVHVIVSASSTSTSNDSSKSGDRVFFTTSVLPANLPSNTISTKQSQAPIRSIFGTFLALSTVNSTTRAPLTPSPASIAEKSTSGTETLNFSDICAGNLS